jgi:hypothetical protein
VNKVPIVAASAASRPLPQRNPRTSAKAISASTAIDRISAWICDIDAG